jgi:hypothetical protein
MLSEDIKQLIEREKLKEKAKREGRTEYEVC